MLSETILILLLSFIIMPIVLEALWIGFQPEETDCDELSEMVRTSTYESATNRFLVDCIYSSLVEAP